SAASHELDRRSTEIIERPVVVHAINLRGVQESLHVFAETKDGWSLLGGVTTDSFKDARTVVQDMRHHVHARVVPLDKLAVMPNNVAYSWCLNILGVAVF